MTEEKRNDLADLITRTWRLIDYINERLANPELSENEKIRWAGVLASAIGTLNKLFYKAGVGKLSEDDLAMLLSKIPKKFRKMMRGKLTLGKSKATVRNRPGKT